MMHGRPVHSTKAVLEVFHAIKAAMRANDPKPLQAHVAEITDLARPGGLSTEGFLASDEDILSVLRGDDALVRAMGLTHAELARPLLHV